MNIVPIAFAFDNNLTMPASIAITSLLMNAKKETFYDIYILHSQRENLQKQYLQKIVEYFTNCKITYREVDDTFDSAFEIRGITTAAYYRLLIPDLVPEYDKIIYADADIIFRQDLSELYATDIKENYIAATYDISMNLSDDGRKHIDEVDGLEQGRYIQSGFIILNNKIITRDHIVDTFKKESKRRLKFQDQDILNIACKNRIMIIPWKYNMTDYSFQYKYKNVFLDEKYANSDADEAVAKGNIHYNGHKPWKKYSINYDIWWEYYRKSPIYDETFYFNYYYDRLNLYDQLPLIKRIKILARYFIYGIKKI